jgi:xylan 1,4-beta-xylosidase
MKRLNHLFLFMLIHFILSCSTNKPIKSEIFLADPTIFRDNDVYYLYGTTSGGLDSVNNGFWVYKSKDLKNWSRKGKAMNKGDSFGEWGFWAPQVFKRNDLYYMAYTANENIAIATSKSPLGPFVNKTKQPYKSSIKQIDPFVFFDNGIAYMYHVRRVNEDSQIFVAELSEDLINMKDETLTKCISSEIFWEYRDDTKPKIAEGQAVIKMDDTYYLFYSANNFRSPDYAVGYATCKNPLGPWVKAKNNPLINRQLLNQYGPGHGDILIDANAIYYVLHTHYSKEAVRPRKTAIIELVFNKNTKEFNVKKETFRFLKN